MQATSSTDSINKLVKIADDFIGHHKVKVILEFGSRYGEDSIEFALKYPNATIYAFECNPNTLDACKANISKHSNIILTEKAISNTNGVVSFFKIDKEKTHTTWQDGNQGASSLLKASGKYPIEKYVQDEVFVQSIKLTSFIKETSIESIDILWMDIQGAELLALQGLDNDIYKIKIIHLEVEFFEIYKGQPLFKDIYRFLKKKKFKLLGFSNKSQYAGDAIFINTQQNLSTSNNDYKTLLQQSSLPWLKKALKKLFKT